MRYNERVRIARTDAHDGALASALDGVERARGDIALTYFEFSTLAAVRLFIQERVDVAVLEVGLGGRLDAVNAFDADCAMLMSIELDHMDYWRYARSDRFENRNFRPNRRQLRGRDPPLRVLRTPRNGTSFYEWATSDRGSAACATGGGTVNTWSPHRRCAARIRSRTLRMLTARMPRDRLPVSANAIRTGLVTTENPGRFQVLPGRPAVILDVAHNPAAARALAGNLAAMRCTGRTYAVFSMLNDKDIAGVIDATRAEIDEWLVSGIEGPRGTDASALQEELAAQFVRSHSTHRSVAVLCKPVIERRK